MKIALLVATVVSPHLTPGNALDKKIKDNSWETGISQPLMMAPKSPVPHQKPLEELPPIFIRIAYCESRDRQFDADGALLHGSANPYDVGRYQINTLQWADEASKLGYDLSTEDGNEAMALYLYKKFGTKPWRSSQKCWEREDQIFADNQ